MRIIEQSKEVEKTCPHCSTKFAYVKDDIWTDMMAKNKCVYCPNCNYRIDVTDEAEIANVIEFKERMKKPIYTCEYCSATFNGEPYLGKYGAEWVACPKCGEETYVSEGIEITADTVEYPKHFFSYGEGKPVDDEQINEWIKDAVNRLDKGIDYTGHASGDTIVLAYKSDEDYSSATVIVAKKYQECEVKIPKEKF